MKKSLLILVLTVLAACSSTETAPDEFTIIAEEWQGGNINEMIAVWGNPKVLEQVSADGEDGFDPNRPLDCKRLLSLQSAIMLRTCGILVGIWKTGFPE